MLLLRAIADAVCSCMQLRAYACPEVLYRDTVVNCPYSRHAKAALPAHKDANLADQHMHGRTILGTARPKANRGRTLGVPICF